jgi:hypothetical protein
LVQDDKSGCAEIMTMIDILRQNPQIKHGSLAIAFTPDEEVGGGIDKFDVKGFGGRVSPTQSMARRSARSATKPGAPRPLPITVPGQEHPSGNRPRELWLIRCLLSLIT